MISGPTLTRAEWRDVLMDKRDWLLRRVFVTPSPQAYWPRVVQLAAEEHLGDGDTDNTGNGRNLREAFADLLTADGLQLDALTVDGAEVFAVLAVRPALVRPVLDEQAGADHPAQPTADTAPAESGGNDHPGQADMANTQIAAPDFDAYKVSGPGYTSQFSTRERAVTDFEKKTKELERTGDRFKVVLFGKKSGGKWETIESRQQNER